MTLTPDLIMGDVIARSQAEEAASPFANQPPANPLPVVPILLSVVHACHFRLYKFLVIGRKVTHFSNTTAIKGIFCHRRCRRRRDTAGAQMDGDWLGLMFGLYQ
ncbi:hypothetical protein E2C01_085387 [Portunus trituberculatus]|uniref:Uncharacterized protein n=1 Tax=Portunus trituberculatus TaxID=210409 RepID=A0A5B7IXQ0_PORTR|nr:hypothetical protein [Portunus trituberculatus]